MLFGEVELPARFGAAARAGFKAVEVQFPYAWDRLDLRRAAERAGVEVVLINIPGGDPQKGDRGIACLPERVAEFRQGVARAIEYAKALGCRQMNCLAGIAPRDSDPSELRETYVSNLRYAAGELVRAGLTLLIEPISTLAVPGFFLNRSADAFAIVEEAGAENLKV
jgi:hydroxypyruvate isomerase